MRRRLPAGLLLLALLGACLDEPMLRPTAAATHVQTPVATGGACIGCLVGPVSLMRGTGLPISATYAFAADEHATYLLELDGVGGPGSEVAVTLNGVSVPFPRPSAPGSVRIAIKVRNTNTLAVRVGGTVGTGVTVTVRAGAAMVGAAGGTITAPGSNATATLVPGTVAAPLRLQWITAPTTVPTDDHLTPTDYRLVVGLSEPGAPIGAMGGLRLMLPSTTTFAPGDRATVRVTFTGRAESWWVVPTIGAQGRLVVDLPASVLTTIGALYGITTLDVTLSPIANGTPVPSIEGGTVPSGLARSVRTGQLLPLAGIFQSLASPSSAGVAVHLPSGTSRYCPDVVNGNALFGAAITECNTLSIRLAPGSTLPTPGAPAIVLVHGWNPDVVDEVAYYREQGLACDWNGTTWLCGVPLQGLPAERSLPGIAYFQTLIPALEQMFPRVPVYVADYQSYFDYRTNGNVLATALTQLQVAQGIGGFLLVGHSMGGLVAREATRRVEQTSPMTRVLANLSLATPHAGTPIEAAAVQFGEMGLFRTTPGLTSLQSVGPAGPVKAEAAPLYAYAGDISGSYTHHSGVYEIGALALRAIGIPYNDGIVPVSSAHPTFQGNVTYAQRGPFPDYDHSDMVRLKPIGGSQPLASDPVFQGLVADITALLTPTGPPAVRQTTCAAPNAFGYWFAPTQGARLATTGDLEIDWTLKGPFNDGRIVRSVTILAYDASCQPVYSYIYKDPLLLGPSTMPAFTPGATDYAVRLSPTGTVSVVERDVVLPCAVGCNSTPFPAKYLVPGYSYQIYVENDNGATGFQSATFAINGTWASALRLTVPRMSPLTASQTRP